MHRGGAPIELQQRNTADPLTEKLRLTNESLSKIDDLQQAIKKHLRKYFKRKIDVQILLDALCELRIHLTRLNSILYQSYIDVFSTLPSRLAQYPSTQHIADHEFELIAGYLATLFSKLIEHKLSIPKPGTTYNHLYTHRDLAESVRARLAAEPKTNINDWRRPGFHVNGKSFDLYRETLPADMEITLDTVRAFCLSQGMNTVQVQFIVNYINQHRFTGIFADLTNIYQAAIDALGLPYFIGFDDGIIINIDHNTIEPESNGLVIQNDGYLIAKSLYNAKDIHQLVRLRLIIEINPRIPWIPKSQSDTEQYFTPDSVTVKLQFRIIDPATELDGLKDLFTRTVFCYESSVVTIEEAPLPIRESLA